MVAYTARMGLTIPDRSEAADIQTIIDNWNKLNGGAGLVLCTSTARPTTQTFPGMYIKEIDTLKHYYLDGSGSWAAGVYSGGVWTEDFYAMTTIINLTGAGAVFNGASMSAPYAIGATNGNSSPLILVNSGTVIDLAATRGLVPASFSFTAATKLKVEFDAQTAPCNIGGIPVSFANGYDNANYALLEFQLWDNGSFIQTLGYASGGLPSTNDAIVRDHHTTLFVNAASGSHLYQVKVKLTGNQDGTSSYVLGVLNATINVTLSA